MVVSNVFRILGLCLSAGLFSSGLISCGAPGSETSALDAGGTEPMDAAHADGAVDGQGDGGDARPTCPPAEELGFRPYIGPYLTLLSPDVSERERRIESLDPTSGMVINFEVEITDPTWTATACVREKGSDTWLAFAENTQGRRIHHIEAKGLMENTTHEYRILDSQGRSSEVFEFTTASANADGARFLAIGDMQDEEDKQRWDDIANEIVANHLSDFDFIITVGDMVYDDVPGHGDRYYFWKVFFDRGRALFARKPVFATPGNHDTPANLSVPVDGGSSGISDAQQTYWSNAEDTQSYRKYFGLPVEQSYADYYSFRYGNALFLSVNSEIPVFYGRFPELDTEGRRQAQFDWFEQTLSSAQEDATWRFGFWHVPPVVPSGDKELEYRHVRPITDLYQGNLDWSITGHTHQTMRFVPAQVTSTSYSHAASYGRSSQDGVGQLICAPAGQWPRNPALLSQYADRVAYYPEHGGQPMREVGFHIIQVSGNHFSLKTYGMGDVDGRNPASYGDTGGKRLLDSLEYSK